MKYKLNFLSIFSIVCEFVSLANSLPIEFDSSPKTSSTIQPSQSLSKSAITSIIVVTSLSILLLLFFLVVFVHYRLIRKVPDDDMGSSSSSAIQMTNKQNLDLKKSNYLNKVEQISTIESEQTRKVNLDQSNRFALQNDYNLLDLKSLSNSTDSVYTPIDNLSEMEEAHSDDELDELINFSKKKSESCENFVVKWQQSDIQFDQVLRSKKNKSIVLSVMNMVWPTHFLNDEKSYY
ncbi:hypothetical protein BpHYR1_001243 [Brachionus plicatilis]|uniref:Uncharacterized protein n=1 Tax=Brachionus plicatilis TaxID=10195 RepID=A0A3M7S5J7_BRAPC|nr:hypothetical protein BpHYR1_001243 [Brachionus plicatilis]